MGLKNSKPSAKKLVMNEKKKDQKMGPNFGSRKSSAKKEVQMKKF